MFQLAKHIANEFGTLTKVCLFLLLLVVVFGLADRANPETLQQHGIVTSTIHTALSMDGTPKEYVWVVATAAGTEKVYCGSKETFRQKSIGDTVTFYTHYGWITGTPLKSIKN